MPEPSYKEIAQDWDLWGTHVDPIHDMPRSEFDQLTVDERIALIELCNGPEPEENTQE